MGKSPAKWIKTLFGKKSSKSRASENSGNCIDGSGGKATPTLGSPVISCSQPINSSYPEIQKAEFSCLPTNGNITSTAAQRSENNGTDRSYYQEKEIEKEVQAAIKMQAASRGFLARRGFHAQNGITKVQALVRGHLVRRQALATFHCMQGVIKLQALVRGRREGLFIRVKDATQLESFDSQLFLQQKLPTYRFICKLPSFGSPSIPLHICYAREESNSIWSWLERWNSSYSSRPLPQQGKTVNLKYQVRHSGGTKEKDGGNLKYTGRGNISATTNITSESEKTKQKLMKLTGSIKELNIKHPQSELEKVKHNLRKITSCSAQGSGQAEYETDKEKDSVRTASSFHGAVKPGVDDSAEQIKTEYSALESCAHGTGKMEFYPNSKLHQNEDITSQTDLGVQPNINAKLIQMDACFNLSNSNYPVVGLHLPYVTDQEENHPPFTGHLASNKCQHILENHKSSKSTFPAKMDHMEFSSQNNPKLPSYMAATESAKAKLRRQGSPGISSDDNEKNGFSSDDNEKNGSKRRHSLPLSKNGKLTSSPQTRRFIQMGGKGGVKSDHTFSSCRDGSDGSIQVEWRR